MVFVFTSYIKTPEYDDPLRWLKRIEGYTGILERLARDHTVISIDRINYRGELTHNGVSYHFIKQRNKKIWFPVRQHRLIKSLKPDVVFVNGLIFPWQTILLRRQLGRSVKIIGIHHAEKPFRGYKRGLQKLADRCFDAYCFASREFGQAWAAAGVIRNIEKVHEIMEVSSRFIPMPKEKALQVTGVNGAPVYLWVGRLNENKDPLTVVNAFLLFAAANADARLYMIYQTSELLSAIQERLSASGKAGSQVVLIGAVKHEDMAAWYSSADFIVAGSHYEGSGTAVCEAMSCGCIPILTDIFSFRMMTGRGKCGWLYESGNATALADLLQQSVQCSFPGEKEKTIRYFREVLSFDAIAAGMIRMISSLR